jgi:hypothetical protein
MSMSRTQAVTLVVLIGAIVALLIVLSGGLGGVDWQPGRLVGGSPDASGLDLGRKPNIPTPRIHVPDFFQYVIPFLLAAFAASTVTLIRNKELRPRLLLGLFCLAAIILLALFWPEGKSREILTSAPEREEAGGVLDVMKEAGETDAVYVGNEPSDEPPRWPLIAMVFLAALIALLATTPLVLFILRRLRRRQPASDLADLVEIAQHAAREIEAGAEPVGVVQRCYARMVRALAERSGVNPRFRTPREFAVDMQDAGLHSESVDALTEMFELVQYGGRADGPFAERAHACLSAVRLSHGTT